MTDLHHTKNRRVLVIDDNLAIHEDFRKILASKCDASALEDAEAALFGEPSSKSPAARFELDSATQGKQGLERVK